MRPMMTVMSAAMSRLYVAAANPGFAGLATRNVNTAAGLGAAAAPVSPHSDPERLEEQRFATDLVHRLDKAAEQASFEHLVVVAPPTMLGDLRHALTHRLTSMLKATLDKDLTKIPEAKLGEHLKGVLPLV